jgi:colanic acid/amylovoran biosynthesis glycosyltransferase
MLRLTFCTYDSPGAVGGPFSWLTRLLPSLNQRGFEVRCLVLLHFGESGPTLDSLRSAGISCDAVQCHSHTRDRVRWILEILRENPPDVFIANLPVAAYLAGKWLRLAGIPTVGVLHSDDAYYRGIQESFVFGNERFRLCGLVCVSKELETQALSRNPACVVTRIPCGAQVPEQTCGRVAGVLRVAYVGRFAEEQKRISELTRAFCRAARELDGVIATLFGDGPDRGAVERILHAEGSGLAVSWGGSIPHQEILEKLLECDVVVLLSDYEGLPIALMEAMACGCVPVCLRMRSGIPELVEDGFTGLIVDDREGDFVEAIRRLRDNPELWQRLSGNARRKIESEYSDLLCDKKWAGFLTETARQKHDTGQIRIPRKIRLPKRNPDLESLDNRREPPGWPLQIWRRGRILAGKFRRRWLGF